MDWTRRRAIARVLAFLASAMLAAHAGPAAACTCRTSTLREALRDAIVVAEAQIIEVRPPEDPSNDLGAQLLRYRFVRIFKGPAGLQDGDESWVRHQRCNSVPFERSDLGERSILFLHQDGERLWCGYCSYRSSAWEPVPLALLQARQSWLRSRR